MKKKQYTGFVQLEAFQVRVKASSLAEAKRLIREKVNRKLARNPARLIDKDNFYVGEWKL